MEVLDGRVQGEVLVVPLVVAAGILEADRGDFAGFELLPRGHRHGAPGVGVRPARKRRGRRYRGVLGVVLGEVRVLPRVDVAVVRFHPRGSGIVTGQLHVDRSAGEHPHGDEEHEDGPEEPSIAGATHRAR